MTVGVAEIHRDFRNFPDVLPEKVDEMAAMPITLPVGVNIAPQVIVDSDEYQTGHPKIAGRVSGEIREDGCCGDDFAGGDDD